MDTPSPPSPLPTRPPELGSRGRWYVRIPVKIFIFLLVTFLVCFPYPGQFARHFHRICNMQEMIDPAAPELDAWESQLRERIENDPSFAMTPLGPISMPAAAHAQWIVERFVLENVKYEWDWNLWGSADYMPSVHEMFEKAKEFDGQVKEDCDGRAVMAASLMKRLGYEPTIV